MAKPFATQAESIRFLRTIWARHARDHYARARFELKRARSFFRNEEYGRALDALLLAEKELTVARRYRRGASTS